MLHVKIVFMSMIELKQISEIFEYPYEIHYLDTDLEPFRVVANYFKQLWHILCLSKKLLWLLGV